MTDMWVPVSGALAKERQIETIANNVANITTPGFKKDHVTFKEYLTVLDKGYDDIDLPDREWSPADFYKSYGAESAKVQVDGSFTDFQQGQLIPTKAPLDLGLSGRGLFEVLTPHGLRFTRRGTFALSSDGFLVNDQNHFVLARLETREGEQENFEDRKINFPQKGQISIGSRGDIFLDGNRINSLSIVAFKDVHSLKKEGHSYFINENKDNLVSIDNETSVHQGFIEASNVNAISEMSELIKANRQFESIQRIIKAYDHIAGRAANDIAQF